MDWDTALYETLHRLETRWLVNASLDLDPAFFEYQSYPVGDFMAGMATVLQVAQGQRFLEIGCGIGEKLSLMHSMGWEVSGLDWNREYVFRARELLPEAQDRIVVADVREVETFDADVIYMWQLAKSHGLQSEIEEHVVLGCQPGTILFTPERDLPLEFVGPNIWRV